MSDPSAPSPGSAPRLDPAVLDQFRQRIARSLEERPLENPPERHREEIAALVRSAGGATFYDLLGVEPSVSCEAVAPAYQLLARRVHPSHAPALGLGAGAAALEMLFELATEAYLVLSDPRRRSAYDRRAGLQPTAPEPSPEEVAAARREMARSNFERAQRRARKLDFHQAVELLRDAVRWDPRPEYLALLGQVMARNPNWLRQGVEHLEQAIRQEPRQVEWRLRLAQVWERAGDSARARSRYQEVLELAPGHAEATVRLEGLYQSEEEGAPGAGSADRDSGR